MITAVLDANILVSGVLVKGGIPSRILDAAYARTFACIASAPLVAEVLRTLNRTRIRRKYQVNPEDIERLRRFLESDLVLIPLTIEVRGAASHPEDDLILATAASGGAEYLMTGDAQLLRVSSFRGTSIVSPRTFQEVLDAAAERLTE